MQAHFGVDQHLLASGDLRLAALAGAGGDQIADGIGVPLDQPECDGSQLVMPRRAPDEADRTATKTQLGTNRRQGIDRAVEVQPDQPPRWPTEVVDPGNGLLTAITPLVQVHRRTQQPELVGDRAMVRVDSDPRYARRDPSRLVRPQSGRRVVSQHTRQIGTRHEDLMAAE